MAIAEQDEKAYRLTAALGLLATAVRMQGRSGQAAALFEQARSANPAFRDTILMELETFAHWMAGDFTAAVATARELAAWVVSGARRRALGLACGGMAAAETGDLREAESMLGRARHGLDGRDWRGSSCTRATGKRCCTGTPGTPLSAWTCSAGLRRG